MRVRLRIEVGAEGEGVLIDAAGCGGREAIEVFSWAIAAVLAQAGEIGELAGQDRDVWQTAVMRRALERLSTGIEPRSGTTIVRTK